MRPTDMPNGNENKIRKVRRISRACDYCHKRSIRCRASQGEYNRCQNCVDFQQPCTYDRPAKRRGAKPRLIEDVLTGENLKHDESSPVTDASGSGQGYAHKGAGHGPYHPSYRDLAATTAAPSEKDWYAPVVASQAMVMDLVEIYFEVVYPIFPFFHRPTFLRQISRGEYTTDRFLFASTMAVCALASARVRDGATFSSRWNPALFREPSSETFYATAKASLPADLVSGKDHNCMRTHALLALTALQYGHIRTMHQALARYACLVSMDGLHDEANWPKDIGIVETEERRRLFWSMYTFDVYTSIVWNSVMRVREAHSDVLYPTEMDDELFDDNSFATLSSHSAPVIATSPSRLGPVQESSWLCGWNFTSDLYRIMEHAVDGFRTRRVRLQRKKSFLHDIFADGLAKSQASVLASVMDRYYDLPRRFKEIHPISLDTEQDRFGFQAANITATVQLLRMVLFSDAGASVAERCEIAREVVDAFIDVPRGYLRAISAPLLHHLSGIGYILSTVFEEPICQLEYQGMRSVLLSMAQLVDNLDVGKYSTQSASERLKSHVARMDAFMAPSSERLPQARDRTHRRDALSASSGTPGSKHVDNMQQHTNDVTDPTLSQFQLPQELLDDWPWIFDFAQTFQ